MSFVAADSAAANDDLTILDTATVTLDSADAAALSFAAGDDVILNSAGARRIVATGGGNHAVSLTADAEGDNGDGDRGSISQTGAGLSIVAPALTLSAFDGIGDDGTAGPTADNALRVDVDLLGASNAGANEVRIAEAGDVAVGLIANPDRTVMLTAGGRVTDGNAGISGPAGAQTEDANVIAAAAALVADRVGENDDFDLAVNVVAAAADLLYLNAAGALTIGAVTDAALAGAGFVGGTLAGLTATDTIVVRAGALAVNERVGGTAADPDVSLFLHATGFLHAAGAGGASGDVALAADLDAGRFQVSLRAGGDVIQSAGTVTAGDLYATAGGSIDLASGTDSARNDAGRFAASAGGSIALTDAGGLTLAATGGRGSGAFGPSAGAPGEDPFYKIGVNGVTSAGGDVLICTSGALAIEHGIGARNGTVRLEAAGDVTQPVTPSQSNSIRAVALGVRATGAGSAIELTGARNDVDLFAADAAGDLAFADVDGFALGTVSASAVAGCFAAAVTGATAGGNLTLDADADGNCTGDLRIGAAVAAGPGGSYAFSANNVTLAADVTATGAGTVMVVACRTIVVQTGVSVSAVDGDVTLSANAAPLSPGAPNAGNFTAVSPSTAARSPRPAPGTSPSPARAARTGRPPATAACS